MKLKKKDLLFWFFAVLPFLMSAFFYRRVPDRIPVHWNAAGVADGYGPKAFGLFGLPAIMIGAAVLVAVMLKLDPRSRNIERSPQMRGAALWFLVVLANAMDVMTILYALGRRFNMTSAVFVLLGLGIAVIGNYLPKCKFNYTMGIRVPWTLADEENWRRTHRMAGPVWIAGGLLIALSGILSRMWLFWIAIALIGLVPSVYSFLLSRRAGRD